RRSLAAPPGTLAPGTSWATAPTSPTTNTRRRTRRRAATLSLGAYQLPVLLVVRDHDLRRIVDELVRADEEKHQRSGVLRETELGRRQRPAAEAKRRRIGHARQLERRHRRRRQHRRRRDLHVQPRLQRRQRRHL